MARWWFEVIGTSDALARLRTVAPLLDCGVLDENGRTFLHVPASDGAANKAEAQASTAATLSRLNGIIRLNVPGHPTVQTGDYAIREDAGRREKLQTVFKDVVLLIEWTGQPQAGPSIEAKLAAVTGHNPELARAIEYLGRCDLRDWRDLQIVLERLSIAITSDVNFENTLPSLFPKGERVAIKEAYRSFKDSANSQDVGGEKARHAGVPVRATAKARAGRATSKATMSLDGAHDLIRSSVKRIVEREWGRLVAARNSKQES